MYFKSANVCFIHVKFVSVSFMGLLNDWLANNCLIGLTDKLEFRQVLLLSQDVSIFRKVVDPVNQTRQSLLYIINKSLHSDG